MRQELIKKTERTGPVLIIEDDPDIAEVLQYCLQKGNFETRVALNAEEGISASLDKNNPPSIILLDLLLPGMNGIELCRRIRSEPLTRSTPILIVTAKASEIDWATALNVGANDYIIKPFSLSEVIARVNHLLGRD